MPASWNSYSKSETALKPLKIIFDLNFLHKSVVNEVNEITRIFFLLNFKSVNNAFFTIFILAVYRFGTFVPIPGIDPEQLQVMMQSNQKGLLGMFNVFAGGAVSRMAIFALNIMPYISAAIIMQLLVAVSPVLGQLKKEGERGRKQINQYTRYGTVFLAALQAWGISIGLEGAGNIVIDPGLYFRMSAVITLVGGVVFLM